MWINRIKKQSEFAQTIRNLNQQVLIVRGARQVGKTSFILHVLDSTSTPVLWVNLIRPSSFEVQGRKVYGRDFFGSAPDASTLLANLQLVLGAFQQLAAPVVIFFDEVDQHPVVLEAVQILAELSPQLKFVLSGSNLENLSPKNAATGRKKYFDLFPILFYEWLENMDVPECSKFFAQWKNKTPSIPTEMIHTKMLSLLDTYLRIGGLPKMLETHFRAPQDQAKELSELMKDLAQTIEENVKAILGEKSKLYEYEDVLRKMGLLSMNTLKFSQLQVNHAGRSEAKKIVNKTVGARVAHKIRLFSDEGRDLSKYILFDTGFLNHLLNGSRLLESVISEKNYSILLETFVGTQLIGEQISRDDVDYWKSGNQAEVEFALKAPVFCGIEVKKTLRASYSLDSFAIQEKNSQLLILLSQSREYQNQIDYVAKMPNFPETRKIHRITLPVYMVHFVPEILNHELKS